MGTPTKGSTLTLRLRITVVPSTQTAIPEIAVEESRLVHTDSGTWFISEGKHKTVTLPPDFYFPRRELAEIGYVPDIDHLEKFVSTWGLFADPHNRDLKVEPKGLVREAIDEGYLNPKYAKTKTKGETSESFDEAKYDALVELGYVKSLRSEPTTLRERLEQFSEYWELLKSGFRIVNPTELTHRLFELQRFAEFYAALDEEHPTFEADLPDVYASFNSALSAFAVRLVIPDFAHADQRPTLYNVVALQIANDIQGQVPKHVCANENCGREFTRQRGRAKYGEYRLKEVLYCSSDCANATSVRNHRRRKAAEKALLATAGSKKNDPELREQPEV